MNLTRQHELTKNLNLRSPIAIIGCGGIGSWTALSLAKLGFTDITLFDDDTVDEENIPSQCYSPNQIGKPKVEALHDVLNLMTRTKCKPMNKKFDGGKYRLAIICVDSMTARKEIAQMYQKSVFLADHVIDARMAIELGVLRSFDLTNVDRYLSHLKSDDDSVSEACSNKAIAYTTMLIGSLVAKAVTVYLKTKERVHMDFSLVENVSFITHKARNDS